MHRDLDVAIVGAGIVGAATAFELARAGRSVALLEQFELGHARGSSHGTSRIFRLSYPDEHYVRLARTALARWRELEAATGESLIIPTGSLDLGAVAVANTPSLAAGRAPYQALTGKDVTARWRIAATPDEPALFQPDGGFARADRAYTVLVERARAGGAEVREHTRATAIRARHGQVELATQHGAIYAGAVVVAAGAWARDLLAPLGIHLAVTVTRETVSYFALEDAAELPSVIDGLPTGIAYALAAPGVGLKAGLHHAGAVADPDEPGAPDPDLVHEAAAWVGKRFPAAKAVPLHAETCLYTNTPDESFVIQRHDRIVVGSACSGHGFKFAPVVGARLAELALEAL